MILEAWVTLEFIHRASVKPPGGRGGAKGDKVDSNTHTLHTFPGQGASDWKGPPWLVGAPGVWGRRGRIPRSHLQTREAPVTPRISGSDLQFAYSQVRLF